MAALHQNPETIQTVVSHDGAEEVQEPRSSAPLAGRLEDESHKDAGPDEDVDVTGFDETDDVEVAPVNVVVLSSSSGDAVQNLREMSDSNSKGSDESSTESDSDSESVEVSRTNDVVPTGLEPLASGETDMSDLEVGPEVVETDDDEVYPAVGVGSYDVTLLYPLSTPRAYHWVSNGVLSSSSIYESGAEMSKIVDKISGRRGEIWAVEGVKADQHAASWPSELKFIVYDVMIRDMHMRPPFSKFQQSVLGYLDVAPSQLHPNSWAFMRAYELACLALNREVSMPLFLHLFELNRRHDETDKSRWEHVSLRARKNTKIFRPYTESLKGNWKSRYYFVAPVNSTAVDKVGK